MHRLPSPLQTFLAPVGLTFEGVTTAVAGGRVLRWFVPYLRSRGLAAVAETVVPNAAPLASTWPAGDLDAGDRSQRFPWSVFTVSGPGPLPGERRGGFGRAWSGGSGIGQHTGRLVQPGISALDAGATTAPGRTAGKRRDTTRGPQSLRRRPGPAHRRRRARSAVPGQTQARVGRTIDLAVDTSGLHFFDNDTGLSIGYPDSTDTHTSDGTRNGCRRRVKTDPLASVES
jgi:hypothetical protein